MKAIDLIKKYPITTKEIKKFYIDKIIEFPDDKTALAWFKLNY